jgi:hypothetical protein
MDSDVSFAVKLTVSGGRLSHAFADELKAVGESQKARRIKNLPK